MSIERIFGGVDMTPQGGFSRENSEYATNSDPIFCKTVERLIFRGREESEYSAEGNGPNLGRPACAFNIQTNEISEVTVREKRRMKICTDIILKGGKPQSFAGKRR